MKRFVIILGLSLLIISCGKSKSGKDLGEEVCACSKKANGMPATDPNRKKEQDACMDKQMSYWNKIKEDRDKSLEFNEALSKCATEQIKSSFGQ